MVFGISFKRLMNTLLVASLFLGLTLALTAGVDARKRVETMTSAQCNSLYTSFMYYSNKAGEAANNGDTAGAQENTQKAAGFSAQARAGGCSWPGAMFPDSTR
jgi:hypothetical protein